MIIEVVDAVRDLLSVPANVVKDDAATEPFKASPNRLYVWPRRLAPQQLNLEAEAGGFFDDATLRVRILLVLPAKGEPRVIKAERALSVALDTWVAGAIGELWLNRRYPANGTLWYHLIIEGVLPDVVRTFEVRGHGLDVAIRLTADVGG